MTTLARRQDTRDYRVPWSPSAWRQALYLTGSIPVLLAAPVLVAAGLLHPPKWLLPLLFLVVVFFAVPVLTAIERHRLRVTAGLEIPRRGQRAPVDRNGHRQLRSLAGHLAPARLPPAGRPAAGGRRDRRLRGVASGPLLHPVVCLRLVAAAGRPAGPLSGVAARTPIPVRLSVDLPRRPAAVIEAVAYFVVSESLTNITKHAQASQAEVVVQRVGDRLHVIVSDDGVGGAEPSRGTGLAGLAKRAASVDGTFEIASPPGGPTLISVGLPCAR